MYGFSGNIGNKKIFDCNRKKSQNASMENVEERPSERLTIDIRLSELRRLETIKRELKRSLPDFECKEGRGTDITVSGYLPDANFDGNSVMAIVRKYDPSAKEI